MSSTRAFEVASRPLPGVWLYDKPVGATSFSAVQEAREALAQTDGKSWSVCHGGALDPFASGVLPLLIGPSTKVFEALHVLPKTYEARILWGTETDTLDPGGQVVSTAKQRASREQVVAGLERFFGWHPQVPPATSNIRVGGERAYAKAHRGEKVELEPRPVYLHSAEVLAHDETSSLVRLVCRGGYYVRALARDLGRALGVPAHLSELRRTSIGPWISPGDGAARRLGDDAFGWWRSVELSDDDWGRLKLGEALELKVSRAPWQPPDGWPEPLGEVQAWHLGRLVAVLKPVGERLVTRWMFPGGMWPRAFP